ncbi:hypothetical protein JCM10213v2_002101 [Rhodosporidiobolus nylandii]
MATLPAVGTRFSSIDDWKRAVYTACLASRTRLGTAQSHASKLCDLRCHRPAAAGGSSGNKCQARTVLSRAASSSEFEVTVCVDTHTCSAEARKATWPATQRSLEKRLKALDPNAQQAEGSKSRPAATVSATPSSSGFASPGASARKRTSLAASPEETKVLAPPPKKRRRKVRPAPKVPMGKGKGREIASGEEVADGSSAWAFSSSVDVEKVTLSADISIPHPYQRFHASTALLMHLHAFASQSSFLFSRLLQPSEDKFVLVGVAKHSWTDKKGQMRMGKVLVEVKGEKGEDGKWGVRDWLMQRAQDSGVASGKGKAREEVPNEAKASRPPAIPTTPQKPSPASPALPAPGLPTPAYTAASDTPDPPSPAPFVGVAAGRASAPRTTALSSHDLDAFLTSLSLSATDVAFLRALLRASAVASVGDLALLMLMSEEGVEDLLEGLVAEGKLSDGEVRRAVELLGKVRKGAKWRGKEAEVVYEGGSGALSPFSVFFCYRTYT